MKNQGTKKELSAQYKERTVIGGAYLIRNTRNNRILIESAADLGGSQNRFAFAQKTGSCVYLKLQADWAAQGGESFVFEVLEELPKGETQTQAEFKADLGLLKELWREKLAGERQY